MATLCVSAALLVACDPSRALYGGSGNDGKDSGGTNPNPDAYFTLGQGEIGWNEIEEGESLEMVLGGQGLLMFPMPMRAGGFTLPDDPKDYTDPDIPILDMYVDIEGFNIGFGGHFSRIANYPIIFDILDDGTYEFVYVTIFVPDELTNPCDIDELPGFIHAELETADGDLLTFERDVEIEVPDYLGTGCTP
ncbi:hypothetical protein G6O69_13680 [Pseudenhygromyxa sp. WMMC2535]|uniref:hypothetical protein n=1 Tax=Pseudenhygromyxa sp. WMMC2535 TaxID=2712867 RepID=UPI001554DE54|nr:hypothetical protein [Pseudenhygromyxa sp. WMMC2535]NVB38887.1 hypothetical protein [Pseudenhygromyxa sp. WMMC2535]